MDFAPTEPASCQPKTIDLVIGDTAISCMLDVGFFSPQTLTQEPHSHLAYELHCLASGSCRMELCDSGGIQSLDPGTVMLLPPGCYHCILCRGEGRENGPHVAAEHIRKYALRFTLTRKDGRDRPGSFTSCWTPCASLHPKHCRKDPGYWRRSMQS